MLKITLSGKAYDLSQDDITISEGMALERFTGQRFSTLLDAEKATSDLLPALMFAWLVRRRNGEPNLDLKDVDLRLGDLQVENVDDPTDSPLPGDPVDPTNPTSSESGPETG